MESTTIIVAPALDLEDASEITGTYRMSYVLFSAKKRTGYALKSFLRPALGMAGPIKFFDDFLAIPSCVFPE